MAKLIIEKAYTEIHRTMNVRCSRCNSDIIKVIQQKFKFCPMCGYEITCIGESGNKK